MITANEYKARRRELMSMMAANSIAVITAAPEKIRSRDTHYPYKQATSFSYLCGFAEPESVLVLLPGREQGECLLFCREKDKLREIWDGYRSGPEAAVVDYLVDDAYTDYVEMLDVTGCQYQQQH